MKVKYKIILSVFLFVLPLMIGFQTFLPKGLQVSFIYMRMLVLPLLFFVLLYKNINLYVIFLFILYAFFVSFIEPPDDSRYFFLVFLSLVASIFYFKMGRYAIDYYDGLMSVKYLAYGVNLFNFLTIVLYFLLADGYIDKGLFFEMARKNSLNMFRFSVGNPIEIPFVMSSLLLSSMILLRDKMILLQSSFLNLCVTVISESRLLVIIAVLMFLYQFIKSRPKDIIITFFFVVCVYILMGQEYGYMLSSYFDRLSLKTDYSVYLRESFFWIVFQDMRLIDLIGGSGLTSSLDLVKGFLGYSATVESVSLQLIYEVGVIGLVLFFVSVYIDKKKYSIFGPAYLIVILYYVQMFVLLPIFTLMPFCFFLFGVATKTKDVSVIA